MKFKTAYDPVEEHDHCGIEFTMPSLTVQDEKDETNIQQSRKILVRCVG